MIVKNNIVEVIIRTYINYIKIHIYDRHTIDVTLILIYFFKFKCQNARHLRHMNNFLRNISEQKLKRWNGKTLTKQSSLVIFHPKRKKKKLQN